jgi:putative pyruvate formate lyase activating enzyme
MRLTAAELSRRAEALSAHLGACDLCPRRCGADRRSGRSGFCGIAARARLAAAVCHLGEEPAITGTRGSGTLFLAGCNLRCAYCQNHQISRLEIDVPERSASELARAMLELQARGAHNIAWVTPSHVVPQLLAALALAVAGGLHLPIVYNTGGYDAPEVLAALDGVVDVYLPDLKYAEAQTAAELSSAPDYWEVARAAVQRMTAQCGELDLSADGIARRGVIVRHLVLPNELAGSRAVLEFLAALEPRPWLSLMAQFYPTAGCDHPLLQRPLQRREYERVVALAADLGLARGWTQELDAERCYRPDFRNPCPFGRSDL